MSDLNTKDGKLSSYITNSATEHFRLYLNNKDVLDNKDLCFFCLKSIYKAKILKAIDFGFIEYFNYDFEFLSKLADSMGHEYSEDEFIPRIIFSCDECKEFINDPDRLFYLVTENQKELECNDCSRDTNWAKKWLIFIFLFHSIRYLLIY